MSYLGGSLQARFGGEIRVMRVPLNVSIERFGLPAKGELVEVGCLQGRFAKGVREEALVKAVLSPSFISVDSL